jgi:predicted amidohydrolase
MEPGWAVQDVRVAAARLHPRLGDADGNRRRGAEAIEAAAREGAQLVVLPELASSGYVFSGPVEARAAAEPVPGPTSEAWGAAAARAGAVVVAGVCELAEDGVPRNSALVLDADGRLLAVYRKLHLWNREKEVFAPGDAPPPVVDTATGRIGVAICYDLWFPELPRRLALEGAELIACPSNFVGTESGPDLPHLDVVVAVATAHVNRVHLVVADRCGDERGTRWLGAALVADADGRLAAPPPEGAEPALAVADLDLARARDKSWGDANDLFADRRPDVYAEPV